MTYLTHDDVQDRDTEREILHRVNQRDARLAAAFAAFGPPKPTDDASAAFLAALEWGHDEGTQLRPP